MTRAEDAPVCDHAPGGSRAYVTLVTNADYALGATALARSIRLSGSRADIVVLWTGGVAEACLAPLAEFGVRLARCDLLPTSAAFGAAHARDRLHGAAPFTKGGKPAFHTPLDNFVKLRLWQMIEYERVVFIDADALVLRNVDVLFEYPEFSAAPNVYESLGDFTRLNSGVFVARPDEATFRAMLSRLDARGAFWRRTDQTFLQAYFPEWHGLPVYCNLLQYVWFNMPELWDWGSARILHYQYEKPWQAENPKAEALKPLIDLWRAYFTGRGIPSDLSALPGPGGGVRVLITGAGGSVGRFVARRLIGEGHELVELGRRPTLGGEFLRWELGGAVDLPEADALVHLALDHVPGAYRGGEGTDPEGFWRRNVDGSARLIEAAVARGAGRVVFLSSRAVYGGHPPGAVAREGDALAPDTLYGRAKRATEELLEGLPGVGVSLRATGVYGVPPGAESHKWSELFEDFRAGREIAPRVATEVHGDDVAAAVALTLRAGEVEAVYNVSDLLLDRHDLLTEVARLTGSEAPLPARAEAGRVVAMATDRLRALGWEPGGWAGLRAELERSLA